MNVVLTSRALAQTRRYAAPLGLRGMCGTRAAHKEAQLEKPVEKNKMHGVYHWQFERAVSVALIPLVAAPLVTGAGCSAVDFGLGVVLPLHCHLGLMQVIRDYVDKRTNPTGYGAAVAAMYGLTALTLYGAWKINTQDVGLTEAFKRLWTGRVGTAARLS